LAILGCTPEDLLGDHDHWMQQVHPDDREILCAALVQLSRQQQPVVSEYRLVPRLGEMADSSWTPALTPLPQPRTRWVRDVMVPHFNEAGQLEGWEGLAIDIT